MHAQSSFDRQLATCVAQRPHGTLDQRAARPAARTTPTHVDRTHAEPTDPWEAAIQQAQAEIRDLIESGDLSHDEVTSGWIETWAADLYRENRKAA